MYAVYHQTDPPTAVDQAIYSHFTNSVEKELIVSSGSILRIYRLNPFVPVPKPSLSKLQSNDHELSTIATLDKPASSIETVTKLECILQVPFFGNVVSIGSGRLPKTQTDSLFLAFDEAKLSIVQYDPDEHGLKIVSLHCFEDDLLRGGFTKRNAVGSSSILRVDPGDRCAAMLVYGRHLAVIPFSRDTGLFGDDLETSIGGQSTAPKTAKLAAAPSTSSTGGASSSTTPYLHSFSVPLDLIDPKLQNVADFCFLHGYYEPTILFLFEPVQSTPGRLALRQDTFCILAVSLNVKDKIYAVIWTVNNLPFDCFRTLAVPKPVGGVVVFGVNSVVYLNQSMPPVGVVLNAIGRETSAFPLRSMEDKKIQLDGCQADFITPNTLVVSLRNGDLYVMTLLVDNMNAVKGFYFDKSQSSVIPSVVRKCTEGYVFLGSRLGNSLLLKYSETNSFAMKVTSGIPAAKRPRLDDENGAGAAAGGYGESPTAKLEDDLELYGEIVAVGTVESTRVSQYSFDVYDSLLNIGPIRQCVFGEPMNVSEEYQNKLDPIVDLVTASGHGKNGCLVVLQRSVRPQVLTTNTIPGAQRLWAVGVSNENQQQQQQQRSGDESGEGQNAPPLPGAHQHLLLSKEVMTMVLELKAEISEVESSGFIMNQRTIVAGNLGNGRYVVQVTPMIVALLEGAQKVQHLALDLDFPISQASIADPYVALLTENGELLLLTLLPDANYEHYELVISQPEIYQNVPATAISAYKDLSGVFDMSDRLATTTEADTDDPYGDAMDTKAAAFQAGTSTKPKMPFIESFGAGDGAEDEDAMLYGEEIKTSSNVKTEPIFNRRDPRYDEVLFEGSARGKRTKGSQCIDPTTVMPTFWLAVARENGLLEIFRLPDFHLVYMVKKFPIGFRTLFDTDPIKLALEQDKPDEKFAPVQELMLVGLGANKARPHLFAVVDEELLIYEAFPYFGQQKVADHLCLRFKRVSHAAQLRNARAQRQLRRGGGMQSSFNDLQQRLYPFDDISGYGGLFVAGAYPYWFFMTGHGILRCHPMHIDGKVMAFSPFHNVNCHQGFIYLNEKKEMRICQLPAHISYDSSYPAHKVNLKSTAHHLVYHLDSRTYAVTVSEKVTCKTMVTMSGDDKQVDVLDKEDPNFIYPCIDKFKVQLYSSETWEAIPEAEIEFDEFEHVTVLKEVQLKSEGTRSGLENYLAMGTIYNYGEEVMVRGRIFIAEVVEVVPEPDKPLTKNKLKILYSQEQKGPVTSMCSIQGYLLTGMGPKVYIWSFKDNDLQGISFLDLQIYIHQMISIRNMALVGDVFRSVCLLRYQESSKALSLASRDPRHLEVYAMEFMIDNKLLGFLISDADGNVYVYTYQPEAKESLGGQKLVRRADMNVGARIHAFVRVRCHVGDAVVEKKVEAATRHLSLFGTLDGAIGYFQPLAEKVYRRLLMLQNILLTSIQHECGLNPKAYRAVKQQGAVLFNPQKNILDGDLLFVYSNLSLTEKNDIAKRIGTTKEQLQDDLLEIERMATHF